MTKTYMPPMEEYIQYLERIWATGWVTNNGDLVQELETRLAEYLEVPYVQFVSNGTIALQIAMRALDVEGEIITTPFSYVATINAILWEHCTPVFVDIEDQTFCIDAEKIEAAITERTKAIMPVHVYGYPCNNVTISALAKKHNLKVIYDGAHAFGCKQDGISILNYGDLSTLSFHATKLFHTVEGGAVIAHNKEMAEKLWLLKNFGHRYDEYFFTGLNGKNSEFHAAMGLCILPKVDELIARRKQIFGWYEQYLKDVGLDIPRPPERINYNYAYHPVLFKDEIKLLDVFVALKNNDVFPRRYFYPALNKLPFVKGNECPIAEDISSRVLCLPLYHDLGEAQVRNICKIIGDLC